MGMFTKKVAVTIHSRRGLPGTQYDSWPYPDPRAIDTDLLNVALRYDLSTDQAILWPERPATSTLDILVAGCGTTEAAVVAAQNRRSRILGIDTSTASLRIAGELAIRHGLGNLTLKHEDLHSLPTHYGPFDLIICTGVLHHLPDPPAAVGRLATYLKPDGAMLLSVYRRHPRLGVAIIQEAMRSLSPLQSHAAIELTRDLIAALPERHTLFANTPRHMLLDGSDADIIDTFLHDHESTYSVPELLLLIQNSGLALQNWLDNSHYYPDASIDPRSTVGKRIADLPAVTQWAVVELLALVPGYHHFVLRRPEHIVDVPNLLFSDRENLTVVLRPSARVDRYCITRASSTFPLTHSELKSIESLQHAQLDLRQWSDRALRDARPLLNRLWRCGHISLSCAPRAA